MENIIKQLSEETLLPDKKNNDSNKLLSQKLSQKTDKKIFTDDTIEEIQNTIWLSVSESAKIGGVNNKTIRRAIQSKKVRFKIVKNRYLLDFSSVIQYLFSNRKLKNKLYQFGIGQYIDSWKQ